jgi:Tol biopolymer transport system component
VPRWWSWPVALASIAACGRFDFESHTGDGGGGDGSAAAACRVWGAFAAPVLLPELDSAGADWAPKATADGLEIYFYSSRADSLGGFDVYSARRSSTQDPFSTPADVPGVSSTLDETVAFVSEDGLTLLVSSRRAGGVGNFDLWIATRGTRSDAFQNPALLANINTINREDGPWLSPDGLRLYFNSDRSTTTSNDIYMASRASVSADFGPPTAVAELNGPGNERDVTLSHDELEVFFATDVSGNYDVYTATRPDRTAAFSAPVLVTALNTAMDDLGTGLRGDGAVMYFNYNTNANTGASDIFAASRPCVSP